MPTVDAPRIEDLLRELAPQVLGALARRHGRFDEQMPLVGYGVAWSATQASPFLDTFLEVALEVASPQDHPSEVVAS